MIICLILQLLIFSGINNASFCTCCFSIEHQSTHSLPVRNVKLYVQMYQICHQFHSPLGGSLQKLLLQCEWASLQACHTAIVLRTFFDYHSGIPFLFPGPHTILFLGLPPSIWWRTSSSIFQRTYSWELNFLKVCLKMSLFLSYIQIMGWPDSPLEMILPLNFEDWIF